LTEKPDVRRMRISIITPSFNQGNYIERTITSVLNQKGDFDLEYLIMDGASTDCTLDILKRYTGKVQWISEKDRGQAHAVNKGFERATGDIIGWINSDDLYEEGALQRICQLFRNNPHSQWVIGRCRIIDADGREMRNVITGYKNKWLDRYDYGRLIAENFISQPAVFFRGSFLREMGLLDESLHFTMDYDLWLRMGKKADPVVIPEYLASFRYHTLSKTKSQLDKSLTEAEQLCRRYAMGRKDILFRCWLYRTKIRMVYRLLNLIGR
jgi:glycosyltransferase involved in cell wall biosynthesis